jgi:hypothetical protein
VKKSAVPFVRGLLMALCLSLMPAAGLAQVEETADAPASPLEQLLEQRAALDLTTSQVGDLEQMRAELASTNGPLVQRMMDLRTQWQQARRAERNGRAQAPQRLERIRTQAERIRQRIQQNNRNAMQRVNRMLTPAQRKQLRTIVQERRQPNAGRRAGGGPNADGND